MKPVDAYPPGSPGRLARENHRWASKKPGWIDYSFLGNGSETILISDIINSRAKAGGDDVLYSPETPGGRTRPDGEILKWIITSPLPAEGTPPPLPFFCGDVTPRESRVCATVFKSLIHNDLFTESFRFPLIHLRTPNTLARRRESHSYTCRFPQKHGIICLKVSTM